MGFFFGHFHQPPSDEGGVLRETSFDAVILARVERHADEEEECCRHDAKLAVFVGVGGLEQEEQEGEDGAAEDDKNYTMEILDDSFSYNLIKNSKRMKNTEGLWRLSFDLEEF